MPNLAKRHEREIDGVEHQLDGHKNGDDVALEDEGDYAESEQDGAENHVIVRRDHFRFHSAGRRAQSRPELRSESGRRLARRDRRNPGKANWRALSWER